MEKIKKILNYTQNKELAVFDELLNISEALDALKEVDLNALEQIKGEKGDKGDKGDTPIKGIDYYTQSEIESIKKSVTPVKGRDYYTDSELKAIIKKVKPVKGKDYKDGVTPIKGLDYFDGVDGAKGENGKDGSPDTPEQIVQKLTSLRGEKRLDKTAIKGLDDIDRKIDQVNSDLGNKIRFIGSGYSGVKDIIAGTNITLSKDSNNVVTLNASGGGGGGISDGDKGDITVSGSGTTWTIDSGVVTDSKLSTGINANKISGGDVSNTEFDYLNGVTSNIQTQLNAKGTGDVVGPSSATNEAIPVFDGTTGKLIKSTTATISTTGVLIATSVQPTNGVLAGSSGTTTTTASTAQLFGSTTTNYSISTGGIAITPGVGENLFAAIFRQSTITEAASGTHPIIGGVAIRAPIINNGAGATTNATTLYLEGAPSGTATPSTVYTLWSDSGTNRFDGTVQLGLAGSVTGVMNLQGSTSGVVTIQPANAAGTWTMTLPTTAGSSGQFLQTNGSGVTTWATATASISIGTSIGSATSGSILFAGTSGVLDQDNTQLYWDNTNNKLILGGLGSTYKEATFGGDENLIIWRDAGTPSIVCGGSNTTAGIAPVWSTFRTRGTNASPSNTSDGDTFGIFRSYGYGGGLKIAGDIQFIQNGSYSSQVPCRIVFRTATTTVAAAERVRIDDSNTTFTNNIIPTTTTTYDIGSSTKVWDDLFVQDLNITSGANKSCGTATLVGGTVTVNNTKVTGSSLIFLTINARGGTVGSVYISARTAATSFTITSTSALDTSTVAWLIVEPL